MATIAELEESIAVAKGLIHGPTSSFLTKTVISGLTSQIAAQQKKIAEIRANMVRLADGSVVEPGATVFGFVAPTIDAEGNPVNYILEKRLVQDTKRDNEGRGYITFQRARQKFQRLSWFEASRFYSSAYGAQVACGETLQKKLHARMREIEALEKLVSFVEQAGPIVKDLTRIYEEKDAVKQEAEDYFSDETTARALGNIDYGHVEPESGDDILLAEAFGK